MAEGNASVNIKWIEGKKIEVSSRGNRLVVDQIYADGREGTGFRPAELLLGALGACTMGTVLTFCKNMNIPVESFSIDLDGKRESAPERVSEILLTLHVTGDIPADRLATLQRVAKGCRIHHTITNTPKIDFNLKVGKRGD